MERKQNKKLRAIAAPRPVAPISLKHSGTTLPVYMPEFNDVAEDAFDPEAESELQQIFGCARITPVPDLFENIDNDAMSIEAGEYPLFALGSPSDFGHLELPRLGPSPILFRQTGESDYSLPSRARNPVTLNTPFSPPKDLALHLEYQSAAAMCTQSLKLALVGMDHQGRTRNRSYSEPIPLYVE